MPKRLGLWGTAKFLEFLLVTPPAKAFFRAYLLLLPFLFVKSAI
ncbi:hypothetical protein [Paenibacillus cellulositrophicus]|nr:hypothetical protein [Paenibacillus cellulositrophicus]